jgi:hypothetical protein
LDFYSCPEAIPSVLSLISLCLPFFITSLINVLIL